MLLTPRTPLEGCNIRGLHLGLHGIGNDAVLACGRLQTRLECKGRWASIFRDQHGEVIQTDNSVWLYRQIVRRVMLGMGDGCR